MDQYRITLQDEGSHPAWLKIKFDITGEASWDSQSFIRAGSIAAGLGFQPRWTNATGSFDKRGTLSLTFYRD